MNAVFNTAVPRERDPTVLGVLLDAALRNRRDRVLCLRFAVLLEQSGHARPDTIAIGISELAGLWSVSDRTAKRDLGMLLERGWIIRLVRGQRGSVSRYRIEYAAIHAACRRVDGNMARPECENTSHKTLQCPGTGQGAEHRKAVQPPAPRIMVQSRPAASTLQQVWQDILEIAESADPALTRAWLKQLTPDALSEDTLYLRAANRFLATHVQTHLIPWLESLLHATSRDLCRIAIRQSPVPDPARKIY